MVIFQFANCKKSPDGIDDSWTRRFSWTSNIWDNIWLLGYLSILQHVHITSRNHFSGISIWEKKRLCRHWHKDVCWQSCSWPLRWTIRSHCIEPLSNHWHWLRFDETLSLSHRCDVEEGVHSQSKPQQFLVLSQDQKNKTTNMTPLPKGGTNHVAMYNKNKSAQLCSPVQALGRILDRNRLIS